MAIDEDIQGTDDQELEEREEAAQAYAGEDPRHFVEYCNECVEESRKATKDIRETWDETWKAYETKIEYTNKEDWQSKVVTNDPFVTCKRATSIIRKALEKPDYFSAKGFGPEDEQLALMDKAMLDYWLDKRRANFPITFTDASEMGFATGQSMELIPRWHTTNGLVVDSVEPWKIFRDPDAKPRDPWSGMYLIHEDWQDLHILKQEGGYINLGNVKEESPNDNQEEATRRKNQFWERSRFRKGVMVREFRGTILDSKGDMLIPNGVFTVAAEEVIRAPQASPYVKIRWPSISFSPFAHLLRFEGRGILEGVTQLWWMSCNLMSLYMDDLTWLVNKMREIDPNLLEHPGDTSVFPGKLFVLRDGVPVGSQAVREVMSRSSSPDVLASMQLLNQKWENGSMVTSAISGLPGERSNVTLGERQIERSNSLGVFDGIGYDLELGAVNLLTAIRETIWLNWSGDLKPSPTRVFGPQAAMFEMMPLEVRRQLLEEDCDLQVSGISAQLQQAENQERLQNFMLIVSKFQAWMDYIKPYELLTTETTAMGFTQPDFIVTKEEAAQIDTQKKALIQAQASVAGGNGGGGQSLPAQQNINPIGEVMPEGGMV